MLVTKQETFEFSQQEAATVFERCRNLIADGYVLHNLNKNGGKFYLVLLQVKEDSKK